MPVIKVAIIAKNGENYVNLFFLSDSELLISPQSKISCLKVLPVNKRNVILKTETFRKKHHTSLWYKKCAETFTSSLIASLNTLPILIISRGTFVQEVATLITISYKKNWYTQNYWFNKKKISPSIKVLSVGVISLVKEAL